MLNIHTAAFMRLILITLWNKGIMHTPRGIVSARYALIPLKAIISRNTRVLCLYLSFILSLSVYDWKFYLVLLLLLFFFFFLLLFNMYFNICTISYLMKLHKCKLEKNRWVHLARQIMDISKGITRKAF